MLELLPGMQFAKFITEAGLRNLQLYWGIDFVMNATHRKSQSETSKAMPVTEQRLLIVPSMTITLEIKGGQIYLINSRTTEF